MDYRLVVAPMLATMMLMAGAGLVFADNDVVEPENTSPSAFEEALAGVLANVTDITANTVDVLADTSEGAAFQKNLASTILDVTKISKNVTGELSDSAAALDPSENRSSQFGEVTGHLIQNVLLITSDVTDTLTKDTGPAGIAPLTVVSSGMANIIKDITVLTEEVTDILSGQGSPTLDNMSY